MAEYNRGDVISTHCDACLMIKNKTIVASYICKDCKDFLCDECYTHHRSTLLTMRHLLVPLGRQANQSDVKSKQASNQNDETAKTGASKYEGQTRNAKIQTSFAEYESGGQETKNLGSSAAETEEYPRETTKYKNYTAGTGPRHEVKQREVSGRKVTYDQNQTFELGMKNMRLDAGTSGTQTADQKGKPCTTVKLKHKLNLRRRNDAYDCDLTGLIVLQDKLIVCDNDNFKLKVYSSSNRFIYEYTCDNAPYDIAMLDINTVIVSSIQGCDMRFLYVGNQSMKEVRKINTEYGCWGVCCYQEKIYCVVKDSDKLLEWFTGACSQVRVYTTDGQLEYKFERLSDGKVEFNNLQYITVNPKTGILYVTDWDKDVVLTLSTSGDVIAVMSPPQLEEPQGIACDEHGHIYVCGYKSNNVMQLSNDAHNGIEILSHRDHFFSVPKSVKVYGNKLIVSHRDGSYARVSIYQIV